MSDRSESVADDVEHVPDENTAGADTSKGVKRLATTPHEKDAKKPKFSPEKAENSPESELVDLTDESPSKGAPKTPRTPKMSREEREKLKKERLEEREKQRAEKERLAEEKRAEREKAAEEKRIEKEKKEKEKLEKKQEEDRKKEEKRREIEEKKREEEEKREAKRKEEEEKKEAKRREEEAIEERKRRESKNFLKFFTKKAPVVAEAKKESISTWYLPFEPKDGMTLAPIHQRAPLPADHDIWAQNEHITSLDTWIQSLPKREPPKINEMKAKLFQFHENRRPPYFGTWRKKSSVVTARTPLAELEGVDYEVDSDEEWEDEPSDCEECNSDDDAEKEKDEEDEEEDDGFFVPPCYLSDGEGESDTSVDGGGASSGEKTSSRRVTLDSDGEEGGEAAEGGRGKSAESDDAARKARLASRASEWSKRTEKKKQATMVPRAIGPVYEPEERPAEFQFMEASTFY